MFTSLYAVDTAVLVLALRSAKLLGIYLPFRPGGYEQHDADTDY